MIDIALLHQAIDEFTLTGAAESYLVDIPDTTQKKREYLGLSALGGECKRAVWFSFRKVAKTVFPPRMLRLFRRGDVEEYRFMYLLRGVGFEIFERDENGKQFKIEDFEGHLSGSMDGVAVVPKKFWIVEETFPILLEYKSYNTKRFEKLKKEGVKKADPKYHSQCIGYMGYNKLKGCLFCAVCKDTDELYFEWIAFHKPTFNRLVGLAEEILTTTTAPERISNIASFWKCSYCEFKGVCHGKEPAIKSCRSCKFSSPGPNKSWICEKGNEFGVVCDKYSDITKP